MAQPYRFRHLTTAEGLLSDLKLVMTEDKQGRLWIGSDEGINIFDGYQLSTFNQADSIFRGSNNILQIYCDKKGTMWVATPLGVFSKKNHDSRFHKFPYDEELVADGVFFGETSDGQVFIANKKNCYALTVGGVSKRLSGLDSLFTKYKSLVSFEQFKDDQWLLAFRSKMILVNITTQKIIRELDVYNAWCAARVDDSTLLAGSFAHDTISLVNINTGKSERINIWPSSDGKPISGYAASIVPVGNLTFAIACRYFGVYMVDVSKREAVAIQHDASDPTALKWNACRRLMVTRNGTMFVHTRGLSFAQLGKPLFPSQKYLVDINGDRYSAGFTTVVQDAKKNYWVGTNKHLALWNRETNKSKYYPFYDAFSGGQKFRTVRTVVTDKMDRIWVGTFGGGIGRLMPDGKFKQYRSNPLDSFYSLPSNEIHAITKDASGNFIICANGGFAIFNPISGTAVRFNNHPALGIISDKTTYYVLADTANNWWIAQSEGLYFYNHKNDLLTKIDLPGQQRYIQTQIVATDSIGNVYAGGLYGLYIISQGTLKVQKVLTKKDGLTSNNIVGLLCDQTGMMWILGNIGVSRYDPVSKKIESFDVRDGIEQSNHTLGNFFMAPDGEVFFTSAEGFNYFHPKDIKTIKRPLRVMLSNIEFTDTILTLPVDTHFELKYNNNNISFSFFAVDFQFGPSIQYRYQLSGFDTGYIYAGKQRTSRYTNLASGKYAYMVEASLNGYDWFRLDKTISIHVATAFWKTWWFTALFITLAGGLLFLFFSYRITKIRKEELLKRNFENQLAQVKMNLLRTQMNPHFLFNSLNSINSFILKNDSQNASGYLSKFSRLMRLILDNSRNEWITLESEIKAIELYVQLESLRFNYAFNYSIDVSDNMDMDNIIIPPMLIQPYIENAIWHGLMYRKEPGGMLIIKVKEEDDLLEVIIRDNGVGRAASEILKSKSALQQKSYGMKITSERMRVVNEAYNINAHAEVDDINNEEGLIIGTEVVLTLKKIVQEQN